MPRMNAEEREEYLACLDQASANIVHAVDDLVGYDTALANSLRKRLLVLVDRIDKERVKLTR